MSKTATIEKAPARKAAKVATSIKNQAAETVEKGVEAAQDSFDQAARQAQAVTEQASQEVDKMVKTGTRFVRENPGTAIAGAVGVGVLVGLALRGRD